MQARAAEAGPMRRGRRPAGAALVFAGGVAVGLGIAGHPPVAALGGAAALYGWALLRKEDSFGRRIFSKRKR